MAENDALKSYKFPKKEGLFTTFDDGDEYKLRVLTTDPVVTSKDFTDPTTGDINISTRYAFVVYNFTLDKPQILNAGVTITRAIQELHQDEDYGADIRKIDIKIKATGNKLTRKYSVQVLPKAATLTPDQIKAAAAIDLEEKVENGQRMSFYKPEDALPSKDVDEDLDDDSLEPDESDPPEESGYDKARKTASRMPRSTKEGDSIAEDIGDEEIDLSDIPF